MRRTTRRTKLKPIFSSVTYISFITQKISLQKPARFLLPCKRAGFKWNTLYYGDQATDRNIQITANDKHIFFLSKARPDLRWGLTCLRFKWYRGLFLGGRVVAEVWSWSLLMPSLRMGGAIPPLCHMPSLRTHLATLYTARPARAPSDRMSIKIMWHRSRY